LTAAALSLSACAGRHFERPAPSSVVVGASSHAQVIGKLGAPHRAHESQINGEKLAGASYAYAGAGEEPSEPGVLPMRVLMLSFHNDVLVGREFNSSIKSDSKQFDDSKAAQLIKSQSTGHDVVRLLGEPTAAFVWPIAKDKTSRIMGYTDMTTRFNATINTTKQSRKVLRVTVNEAGTVTDVELTKFSGD